MSQGVGLGDANAQFNVYIGNCPDFADFTYLTSIHPLAKGEIQAIGKACGNGWRKVFNVYAKLLYALNSPLVVNMANYSNWQTFRDEALLMTHSNTSLLFTPPNIALKGWHIVMGKTYAATLDLPSTLEWLDHEFALDKNSRLIVCPYFDYRQLSNIKIIRLVSLIQGINS